MNRNRNFSKKFKAFACVALFAGLISNGIAAHATDFLGSQISIEKPIAVRKDMKKYNSEVNERKAKSNEKKLLQIYFIIDILKKDFNYNIVLEKPLRKSNKGLNYFRVWEFTDQNGEVPKEITDNTTGNMVRIKNNLVYFNKSFLNNSLIEILEKEVKKRNGEIFSEKSRSRFNNHSYQINYLMYEGNVYQGQNDISEAGLKFYNALQKTISETKTKHESAFTKESDGLDSIT